MEETTWTLRDLKTTPTKRDKRERQRKPRVAGQPQVRAALEERRDKMLGGMEAVYAAAQRAREEEARHMIESRPVGEEDG